MMTPDEIARLSDSALLGKIAEESSEVIKAAMKMQAHGPRPYAGGVQYNNVRDVLEEFGQLSDMLAEFRVRWIVESYL